MHEWEAKDFEKERIVELIKKYNLKSYFEIGAFEGGTLDYVAKKTDIKVKGIDVIDKKHPNIEVINSRDYKGDECFDIIFIDGSHEYGDVFLDTQLAFKMLPKVIVWHDYKLDGIKQAIKNLNIDVVVEENLAIWIKE